MTDTPDYDAPAWGGPMCDHVGCGKAATGGDDDRLWCDEHRPIPSA